MNRRFFLKMLATLTGGAWGETALNRTFASVGEGQRFYIPPTIHHVTEAQATLYFRVSEATSNGQVLLNPVDAPDDVRQIPFSATDVLRQQVILDNLNAATTYQYRVQVDDQDLVYLDDETPWGIAEFTTPPYESPFRVVAVGDSGFGHDTSYRLGKLMAEENPHAFFHLGDVVYWMHEYNNDHFLNWKLKYFDMFKPVMQKAPHYATFGNHDQDGATWLDEWPSYYWMFPPFNEDNHEGARSWYAFDYHNIQFVCLNSQLFYSYPNLKNQQTEWLQTKLARDDVDYTVVFYHVTSHTSAAPHQWDGIYSAEQWGPLFEEANVPLVIAGHAHVYERLALNGVHYLVAGAGSDTIYGEGQRLNFSQTFWRIASFPVIDFYPDRIHIRAKDVNGDIFDEVEIPIG